MKKLISILSISALILPGCQPGRWVAGNKQLDEMRKERRTAKIIKSGEGYAFKDLKGKYIILENRPSPNDKVTISVERQ